MAKNKNQDPKQTMELADDALESVSGGVSTEPMAQIKIDTPVSTKSSTLSSLQEDVIKNIR